MSRSAARLAALLSASLCALPAAAAEVTIAVGGAFTSLDPHYHNLTPNSALTQHIFDRLVNPDANLRPEPALARSWAAVAPNVWEFRLRDDVRFHDGTPFTADDVAFTIARVSELRTGPGGYALYTRPVREVVVVDPHTVRLVTAAPAPLIPAFMAALPMVGRRNGEGAATADYNSGRAAVGTGPYRLVSYTAGDRAVFERNAQWWGAAQPWSRVTVRLIANDAETSKNDPIGGNKSRLVATYFQVDAFQGIAMATVSRKQLERGDVPCWDGDFDFVLRFRIHADLLVM